MKSELKVRGFGDCVIEEGCVVKDLETLYAITVGYCPTYANSPLMSHGYHHWKKQLSGFSRVVLFDSVEGALTWYLQHHSMAAEDLFYTEGHSYVLEVHEIDITSIKVKDIMPPNALSYYNLSPSANEIGEYWVINNKFIESTNEYYIQISDIETSQDPVFTVDKVNYSLVDKSNVNHALNLHNKITGVTKDNKESISHIIEHLPPFNGLYTHTEIDLESSVITGLLDQFFVIPSDEVTEYINSNLPEGVQVIN